MNIVCYLKLLFVDFIMLSRKLVYVFLIKVDLVKIAITSRDLRNLEPFPTIFAPFSFEINRWKLEVNFFPAKSEFFPSKLDKVFGIYRLCWDNNLCWLSTLNLKICKVRHFFWKYYWMAMIFYPKTIIDRLVWLNTTNFQGLVLSINIFTPATPIHILAPSQCFWLEGIELLFIVDDWIVVWEGWNMLINPCLVDIAYKLVFPLC